MLCHQRAQLHSAYTVLDGGCCLFFPFFMDEICPLFWELRVKWWWIVGAPRVRDWMSERTERERTWTQVCDAEKGRDGCEKNLCERVWTGSECFFFFCRTIRRTFIYILPSLLFCLPSSLSYIAIIFKELHLKKKKITPKKAICSGMFKWSTKYVFLLNLMWMLCMVCVLSRCYWTHLCERDVMLSVGGALGVGGEWGWAWALSGLTGVMYWWWKRRMLQEEVSFVMCFECFLYVLWI